MTTTTIVHITITKKTTHNYSTHISLTRNFLKYRYFPKHQINVSLTWNLNRSRRKENIFGGAASSIGIFSEILRHLDTRNTCSLRAYLLTSPVRFRDLFIRRVSRLSERYVQVCTLFKTDWYKILEFGGTVGKVIV